MPSAALRAPFVEGMHGRQPQRRASEERKVNDDAVVRLLDLKLNKLQEKRSQRNGRTKSVAIIKNSLTSVCGAVQL